MALAHVQLDEELAQVTLDRPDKRNALSRGLIEDTRTCLEQARQEGARALLFTANGPSFCAGGDVDWMRERQDDPRATREALKTYLGPLIEDVATFPAPSVSAVEGAALGAGLGLALACDVTIAAEDAVLGATHARLGLTPDGGTSWFLARALGPKRALELVLSQRTFSGVEAHEWGLVTRAEPPGEVEPVARRRARGLAKGPTQAYRMARQLVQDAVDTPLYEMLDREAEAQAAMYRTRDQTEGVEAFLEDRDPAFEGR